VDPAHPAANACLAELLAERSPDRAETLARRAVAAAPRDPAARVSLGVVLGAMGRTAEAAAETARAAREFPNDARLQTLAGVAAMTAERWDEAKAAFERAERLGAANPIV